MVSPHGIQLAVHIISSFYGDLCSKVCECLLRRGTLTLAQLIRFTELTREHVVNCLRVLIHQNCVQAFAIQQDGAFGEAPRIITKYMSLFDNIIHKSRAPKFMQIVSDELGKDCLGIFQGLLQHGRLSINQIIERNEESAGSSNVHIVRESFSRLLSARFVERCPAPEPFLAPPSDEETAAKKRSARSAKLTKEQQTTEQRALAAAAPMESLRFLMEMDDLFLEKNEESPKTPAVGDKRKNFFLKSDDGVLDGSNKKILWRVNFEEFIHRLRDKACVTYMKTTIDDEAGIVLGAILELTRHSEAGLKAEKSPYLSVNAIYDEVIKRKDGLGMDLERVRASLAQLGCETLITGLDENYSTDIKRIIEMAQNDEVESTVLRRRGRESYRIFRLLSKKGRLLETDKISESTFVEKKDAIKFLYQLWQDDFLHMETLQKASTTGTKQSPFLLWRVNKETLQEKVLDEMYHAALNLRLRISHEQDQGKEVLHLPKEKLVGELEKKYKLLQRVRIILESSLMNLDDSIMLFHDF